MAEPKKVSALTPASTTLSTDSYLTVQNAASVKTTASTLADYVLQNSNKNISTTGTINKISLTAPANGSTLTITDGKTVAVKNSLTLQGSDGTTITFPSSNATLCPIGGPSAGNAFVAGNTTVDSLTTASANITSLTATAANLGAVVATSINGVTPAESTSSFSMEGGTSASKTLTVDTTTSVSTLYNGASNKAFASANLTVTGAITASTAIADNTATTQVATTAYAKAQDAVLCREPNQAVSLTAGTSTTQLTVSDNSNIDFGSESFTLCWKGIANLIAPATATYLIQKWNANTGFFLQVLSGASVPTLTINTTAFTCSAIPNYVNGTIAEITAVATVGTVNTTVDFYFNGVALGTQQTAVMNKPDISNTSGLVISGYGGTRTYTTCIHAYVFNRALSAAEVLDLYRNGISYSDKWGSQTSYIVGDNSTFASDTGFWTKGAGVSITDGVGRLSNVAHNTAALSKSAIIMPSKRYRVILTLSSLTAGGVRFRLGASTAMSGVERTADGTYSEEMTSDSSTSQIFYLLSSGVTTVDIDNVEVYEIGATLALESESWRPDKPYDASSNNLTCAYPSTGWSLTKPSYVPSTGTALLAQTSGNVNIGSAVGDGVSKVHVTGAVVATTTMTATQHNVPAMVTAPTAANATGTLGEVRVCADAIYVCTATDTWKKTAIATWS